MRVFPDSSLIEVAMSLISSGKVDWLRLIPIPTITTGGVLGMHSHKIPASFFPFNKMSFGHLSFTGTDACCWMEDAVATPAIKVMRANFSGGRRGFKSIER